MLVSGVLTVSINPPILGKAGWTLCSEGFIQMYSGLNGSWSELEKSMQEIKTIEEKTKKIDYQLMEGIL